METLVLTTKSELEGIVSASVQDALEIVQHSKEWLTNPEALEFLHISRPTLQRLRSSGKLPFSKVGAKLYYRRADIEALFVASGAGVPTGRATGRPALRGVSRVIADVLGVETTWPDTDVAPWATALPPVGRAVAGAATRTDAPGIRTKR